MDKTWIVDNDRLLLPPIIFIIYCEYNLTTTHHGCKLTINNRVAHRTNQLFFFHNETRE